MVQFSSLVKNVLRNSGKSLPEEVYEKLPESTIRLLVLHPGRRNDKLRGHFQLQQVSRSAEYSGVPYEALSYTWGELVFSKTIACVGTNIPITQNLFEALIHIRDTMNQRILWIDAISIKQQDREEKSMQIPLMRYVYVNAKQVIIWLGLEDHSTGKALDLVKHAARCARIESGKDHPRAGDISSDSDKSTLIQQGFPFSAVEWLPLRILFSKRWFTRKWIMQEILLAAKASMLIGRHELDWMDLCAAIFFLSPKAKPDFLGADTTPFWGTNWTQIFILCHFSKIGRSSPEPTKMDIRYLLMFTRKFYSSEPRDTLFAVLGMAENAEKFMVDYEKSLRDIFTNVAASILEGGWGLNYLSDAERCEVVVDDDFPSWVPRWHDPHPEIHKPIGILDSTFNGGDNGSIGASLHPENPYIICARGFELGKIEAEVNTNLVNSATPNPSMITSLWKLLSSLRNLVEDIDTRYVTGESFDEVFAQILTVGQLREGNETLPRRFQAINYQISFVNIFRSVSSNLIYTGKLNEHKAMHDEWGEVFSKMEKLVHDHELEDGFGEAFASALHGRKPFRTKQGHLGLGPRLMQLGDRVCILSSTTVPAVLRPKGERFQFLGECYVHGIMHGEALEEGQTMRRVFEIE